MSETLIEINTRTSDIKNAPDNSFFSTTYGAPLECPPGSTIDFQTSFIDLGVQADDLIYVPNNIILGINFFRYDIDIPKVPTAFGTDPTLYSKRTMYVPAPNNIVEFEFQPTVPHLPQQRNQYGYKTSTYDNCNMVSFLMRRMSILQTPWADANNPGMTEETFEPEEETATITVPAGFYSKARFCQLVNDGFNLITGGFTDQNKPLVVKTAGTQPYMQNTITPLDYQIPPNSTNRLLKAYEYTYTQANVKGKDPMGSQSGSVGEIYVNDRNWPYWYFPVYNTDYPQNQTADDFYPYVWATPGQSGFMAGSSKFNLNYNSVDDYFYIDYCHSPILDSKQAEVVVMSKAKANFYDFNGTGTDADANIGYKANGKAGGILITRLYSYNIDNTGTPIQVNTNFWQDILGFQGFDDAARDELINNMENKTIYMYNNMISGTNTGKNVIYKYNISYPQLVYMSTNTTDALIPVQWLVQSNYTTPAEDKGFSIASGDIPKVFTSIGTRPILAQGAGAFQKEDAYFLLDINVSHLKGDNYRDRDSYRQIMAVSGRVYNSGVNYIQAFNDCAARLVNLNETILIDKIEIKILNPDKSLCVRLGEDSTIFLKLTRPIIVDSDKIK